jgi:copper chaperone
MTWLSVPDMSCNHCKAAVETALRAIPNAGTVSVDLASRQVEVTGDAPPAALVEALLQAGYPAQAVSQRP